MKSIYFELKNCYGISDLEYTFGFDENKKAHLIYAPNGTMKSSFARTIQDIREGRKTKDYYYPDRKTKRIVKYDDVNGKDLEKDELLVIKSYQEDYSSDKISLLLANKDLKEEYESIHNNLKNEIDKIISILKRLSGKTNALELFFKDFNTEQNKFYDCLSRIYAENKDADIVDYSAIKYGKLFTTDTEALLTNPEFAKTLQDYIIQYELLINSSSVFSKTFNHNVASDTVKSLAKDGFFKRNHRVLLNQTEEPLDETDFNKAINEETERTIEKGLAKEFNALDSQFAKKAGTRALRDFLEEHKELIPDLADVERLKRDIWVSYLFSDKELFQSAVTYYHRSKKEIDRIIAAAKEQQTTWNRVVDQFNRRFNNMPFKVEIQNKEDVILGDQTPAFHFTFQDRKAENPVTVTKNDLITNLSEGEKKALYLLDVIFEVKARREQKQETLLILDDIADSFDYRNKYAIIEFIIDIINDDTFIPIILTHNFDFYRTLASKAGLKSSSYFTEAPCGKVCFNKGEYFEDVFSKWKEHVCSSEAIFLASIAFIRNLIQYENGGTTSKRYLELTSLLHYKKNGINGIPATDNILVFDLCGWIAERLGKKVSEFEFDKTISVSDLLTKVANDLASQPCNPIKLENKTVMAIAIRQHAERYMVTRIDDDAYINAITGNQTRKLKDKISFNDNNADDREREKLIDRVLITTSEHIHLNSFMYEPLIDVSLTELIELYNDVTHKLQPIL